ncbi:MAG: hypothetical protein CMJ64_29765 [Planctomycetaceae bacterium]|nr:hypothetical protein [Planctomycetaceae bacterium]
MTLDLAPGWTIDVDRGPDWLFIRLHGERPFETEDVELAEPLWQLMQQHFVHRIVLELDEVPVLHSRLIGELVRLHKRVESQSGLLRLCGLSDVNQQVLRTMHIADRFPQYATREAAVMGDRPTQPR